MSLFCAGFPEKLYERNKFCSVVFKFFFSGQNEVSREKEWAQIENIKSMKSTNAIFSCITNCDKSANLAYDVTELFTTFKYRQDSLLNINMRVSLGMSSRPWD